MCVVRVLGEVRDGVLLCPVQTARQLDVACAANGDLRQDILVLVIDSVAQWHLVDVNSLLQTVLGLSDQLGALEDLGSIAYNDDIKRSIENASDLAFSDDRSVPEGQVVDQHTQVEVDRLILGEFRALCVRLAY